DELEQAGEEAERGGAVDAEREEPEAGEQSDQRHREEGDEENRVRDPEEAQRDEHAENDRDDAQDGAGADLHYSRRCNTPSITRYIEARRSFICGSAIASAVMISSRWEA